MRAANRRSGHTATPTCPLPKALPAQGGGGECPAQSSTPAWRLCSLKREIVEQSEHSPDLPRPARRTAQRAQQAVGPTTTREQPRSPGQHSKHCGAPRRPGAGRAAACLERRRGVGNYVNPSSRQLAALSILRSTALPRQFSKTHAKVCAWDSSGPRWTLISGLSENSASPFCA